MTTQMSPSEPSLLTFTKLSQLTPIPAVLSHLQNNKNISSNELPPDFTHVSPHNQYFIGMYTLLFIFAAFGNISLLISVVKPYRLGKSGTSFLLINLCLADLIVTFFLIPTEIIWRWTIAWEGGTLLCKLCQFVRVFGMYLSSNVVICISVDRYYAIVQLKLTEAGRRAKMMVIVAWILAALFAAPQIFVYHVASHPQYPEFQQCITTAFLATERYNEVIYNISSVTALYFVPLLVIIYTYSRILWKIHKTSREHHNANQQSDDPLNLTGLRSSPSVSRCTTAPLRGHGPRPVVIQFRQTDNGCGRLKQSNFWRSSHVALRSTPNRTTILNRARSQTLRLTLRILLAFIFCWTPYVVMTLWYMWDRNEASKVDEYVQEVPFFMAIANSLLNPIIYGMTDRKRNLHRRVPPPSQQEANTVLCCGGNGFPETNRRDSGLMFKSTSTPFPLSTVGNPEIRIRNVDDNVSEVGLNRNLSSTPIIATSCLYPTAYTESGISPTSPIVTMKTRAVPFNNPGDGSTWFRVWRTKFGNRPRKETTYELTCASTSGTEGCDCPNVVTIENSTV